MTREEILTLLATVRAAYPNTKIADPNGTVNSWMLMFSEYDAGDVYKAAKAHMAKNRFFPVPADILNNLNVGHLLYENQQAHIPPTAPQKKIDDGFCSMCELCDRRDHSLCEFDF